MSWTLPSRIHPFLGPGIGIIIIDECTPKRIHSSMILEAGLYNEISQAYASVDTSQAVLHVQGDKRHMGYIAIVFFFISRVLSLATTL
ncbi:hypothetical protein DL765_007732 [Monosporascus sp. GIB2]|nr:hypothetical protein DL765_007732 [Monosporascus sp. GIB2]